MAVVLKQYLKVHSSSINNVVLQKTGLNTFIDIAWYTNMHVFQANADICICCVFCHGADPILKKYCRYMVFPITDPIIGATLTVSSSVYSSVCVHTI